MYAIFFFSLESGKTNGFYNYQTTMASDRGAWKRLILVASETTLISNSESY